ncbi:MAG: hypothetical protein JKY49_18245 [Cohaesibacteraceae bacterium]|nr:hypothetical protein [Cohaesibacteraceae bacterium]
MSFTNFLVIMFAATLMIMGMAGLPFELFGKDNPSPFLVSGLRLAFVGVIALAVGCITGFGKPFDDQFGKEDQKDWFIFLGMAVIGVNGTLTIALYLLDDRLAMAVMFAFIGIVFIGHHPGKFVAWVAAVSAFAGTALLAFYSNQHQAINIFGVVLAAIGGTAQGIMFFKNTLMPKNVDRGIALGSAFFLGGLLMIICVAINNPADLNALENTDFVFGMFVSALMTVPGWLMLGYFADLMSGPQKAGAATLEPVGALATQAVILGLPLPGEWIGVALLVFSASMAVLIKKGI